MKSSRNGLQDLRAEEHHATKWMAKNPKDGPFMVRSGENVDNVYPLSLHFIESFICYKNARASRFAKMSRIFAPLAFSEAFFHVSIYKVALVF